MEEASTSENAASVAESSFGHYYKNVAKVWMSTAERRQLFLGRHKERHDAVLDGNRDLSSLFEEKEEGSVGDEEDEMDFETTRPWRPTKRIQFRITRSEWLRDLPEDLSDNWLVKFCPIGKRRLVIVEKNLAKCFDRFRQEVTRFPSYLSGGVSSGGSPSSPSGLTVLDCVFHKPSRTYYVLDMLVWRSVWLLDCDAEMRHSWLSMKYAECNEMFEAYGLKSFEFKALPSYNADVETIKKELFDYKTRCEIPCDGILFYHKEAPYICGTNPLVTWLKPFMLPEKFGIEIPEEYASKKPLKYTTFDAFMNYLEEKRKKKKPLHDVAEVEMEVGQTS